MSLLRNVLLASLLALPIACGAPSGEEVVSTEDGVTSVENTGVKQQAIGNCWTYATAGWVESLHKGATTSEIDVSEAYWNYWYWYEQITDGGVTLETMPPNRTHITEGGWWGLGVALIYRYGWMHEADFIPSADAKAARHTEAVKALNESLKSGALMLPAARKDTKLVRQELDRVWKLDAKVIADMDALFTAPFSDLTLRAADSALPPTRIHASRELPVLAADGTSMITLADAVGTLAPGSKPGEGLRTGPEAWSEMRYAWADSDDGRTRRVAMMKNVQNVLNRRLAVPFGWWVSTMAKGGKYEAAPVTDSSIFGIHESLLVDYEIDDVPGFGTLRADVRETRPEALDATLDDRAHVKFFRIKNSWGIGDPAKATFLPDHPGYNDLSVDYLDRARKPAEPGTEHMLLRIALPTQLRFAIK